MKNSIFVIKFIKLDNFLLIKNVLIQSSHLTIKLIKNTYSLLNHAKDGLHKF